jgi:signal transduction histidine kinase
MPGNITQPVPALARRLWHSMPLRVVIAATALIALCWLGVEHAVRAHRMESEERLAADLANHTLALQEQLSSQFLSIEEALQVLEGVWLISGPSFDWTSWTRRLVMLKRVTSDVFFADEHGIIRNSGRPDIVGTDVSASDYFRHEADPTTASGTMFIGAVSRAPGSSGWQVNLAHRLSRPDGSLAGVVVAAYDLANLSRGFDRLDVGAGGLVMLVSLRDATVLASSAPNFGRVGTSIAGSAMILAMRQTRTGQWEGPSAPDGIKRVHAFRDIPDRDLAVVVGVERVHAMQPSTDWERGVRSFALGTTALILLSAALVLSADQAGRRRQEALSRERARFAAKAAQLEATLAGMSDGLMMMDGAFRLLEWNERFADFTGVPRDILQVGLPMADILRAQAIAGEFGPVDVETEVAGRLRLLESGQAMGTIERVRPNGRVMELRRSPLPDGGFVTLYSDITARRQAEELLRETEKLAAIGRLTAGIAHDFNNLLTAISGNAELLEHAAGRSATDRQLVSVIQQAASRGADLVRQMLTFARKQSLTPVPIDLNNLVRDVCELLRATLDPTILIQTKLPPTLWPALADPAQLEQVILNLAINARDAMPGGGTLTLATSNFTSVRATPIPDLPPGEYVALAITDTGIGMAEDVQRQAFEPFFTTKPIGEGAGLGLSQVYGIVRQSGGDVRIETAVGSGTTIRVFLPRSLEAPSSGVVGGASRAGNPAVPKAASRTTLLAGRSTILVVEDQPLVRGTLTAILAEYGLVTIPAESGPHALQLIADGLSFDLLLTDFAMPGMNGAELASLVRQKRPGVPVMFITGYQDHGQISQEQWVLMKPFTASALMAMLQEALGGEAAPEASC